MWISHEAMAENLDGMYWDHGDYAPKIKGPLNIQESQALSKFKRALPSICWNYLTCFENIKATLVQTEMVLRGIEPSGIDNEDFLKIVRFGQTASRMCELISNNEFDCSYKSLEIIAQCFNAQKQGALSVKHGLEFLLKNFNQKKELSVAVFLYLLRQKPFSVGNEVSAALFMNGILISKGFGHIILKERDLKSFKLRLTEFIKSGCATYLMHFFTMTQDRDKVRHERFTKLKSKTKNPLTFF